MDDITAEIIGIIGLIIVQSGSTIRAWLSSRKYNTQIKKVSTELIAIKIEVETTKKLNEKQHKELYEYSERINEKIEHNAFIPAFETTINAYINSVLNGFSFDNKKIQGVALSIGTQSKQIFVNMLKIGFDSFSLSSLLTNFDMQEMKLIGILDSHNLQVNKAKLIDILKVEQESFIINIQQIVEHKSNGVRQVAFDNLCKDYLFNVIKEISKSWN